MKLSGESIKKNRLMSVAAATLVVSTLTGAHTAKPSVNSPPKVEASATPETEQNLIFSPMFFEMQDSLADFLVNPPENVSGGVFNGPPDKTGKSSEVLTAKVDVKDTASKQNQVFLVQISNPDVNSASPIAPNGSYLNIELGAFNLAKDNAFGSKYFFQLLRLRNGDWGVQTLYGSGKDKTYYEYSTDPSKDTAGTSGYPIAGHIDFVRQLLDQARSVLKTIEQDEPIADNYPPILQP